MCLATKQRLFNINLINSNICDKCTSNSEETQLHLFYECDYVKPFYLWIIRCLTHLCNFKPSSNIRFLFLDNSYNNSYQKNICNAFIYIYILTIWRTRKENLRIGDMKIIFIRKLNDYKAFLKLIPKRKFEKLSIALSALDTEISFSL